MYFFDHLNLFATKKLLKTQRLLFFLLLVFFVSVSNVALSNEVKFNGGLTVDCSYKVYPEKDLYDTGGDFSYKLDSSRVEATAAPIGSIAVQPQKNYFDADGYFEVLIDDQSVDLYSSPDMESSDLEGKRYEYKKDDKDLIIFFNSEFYKDAVIVLKHWHGEEEKIVKDGPWTMVVQCPDCSRMLNVVAINDKDKRKRTLSRFNTTGTRTTVFQYPGGTGTVHVSLNGGYAGESCGWYAETKHSWITFTSEPSGTGDSRFTFTVDKNDEERERTGYIEVLLEDNQRLEFITVIQRDKILENLTLNYPSNVIYEEGESIPYINETKGMFTPQETVAYFTVTAHFSGDYSIELDRDFNLIWHIDSPDFAKISNDGKLTSYNVDEDVIINVTAIYYYKNFGIKKTKVLEKSKPLKIKDLTELNRIEISGPTTADEFTSLKRYSVMAGLSNYPYEIDVTNKVNWQINTEKAIIDQSGLLTVYSVDNDTQIIINASYTHKVTKEDNHSVYIRDRTELDRISIIGKSNVQSNASEEYIVIAHFNNEPDRDITDQLRSFSLDASNYVYAGLDLDNKKLVLTTNTVESPKDITMQVSYNYKGVEKRDILPIILDGTTSWELSISSENVTVVEGEQLNLRAIQSIQDQDSIDVTDSAIWSLDDDSSEFASINKGVLSANMLKNGDKQVLVKACFDYQGFTKCDSIYIRALDLTELYLEIAGPDSITEGEVADYSATAIWTNEDDEEVSKDCIWTISSPEFASVSVDQEKNKAILSSKNVLSNEQITIKARYSAYGKTSSASKTIDIKKIPELTILSITGPAEVDEKSSDNQYEAKATLDNGVEEIVTAYCKWSISDSDLGFITDLGSLSVNSVFWDETVSISATYTRVDKVKVAVFPVLIKEVPEFFNIKGDITFEEFVEGTLIVKACMADDETCYTYADMYSVEWDNVGTESSQTYTSDIDFDKGTLVNLNHDEPNNDQLQMNTENKPFPFIVIACSDRGTAVRINTETGDIIGEYWTAPDGRGKNPSRTTVDLYGNVWVGNRDETEGTGSIVKIGLVVGGTRCNADGSPNSEGEYLKPPFIYNTCIDKNEDGLIKTSIGLGDILPWSNSGGLDTDGGVDTADDEAILLYVKVNGTAVRHVSINADNNVWVGGYNNQVFDLVHGDNGGILASVDLAHGGYGGLIDQNDVLWSSSRNPFGLLRYDTNGTHEDTSDDSTLFIEMEDGYGMSIDSYGNIWHAQGTHNTIYKVDPQGNVYDGFPKSSGGGGCTRGVAVTPSDNNVWIANSHDFSSQEIGEVCRLDNDGNFLKYIKVGKHPTGVAVDANGFVWVSNRYSSNVMRIDPNAGEDKLGEVDLTVNLGDGARPYNYSDMTGIIAIHTAAQGSWNVIHSSINTQAIWTKIEWTSEEPEGTSIRTLVRAADTQSNLTKEDFIEIENGNELQDIIGKYIEIQVIFNRSSEVNESPILFDMTITEKLANSMPYRLVVPDNDQFRIRAFIDIDNDGINNNCEPTGVYPGVVSEENLNADFSLVIPDICPKSGLALDMYLSDDIPYDQTAVSYVGIEEETPRIMESGEYVYIGVVAQNVTNLDTFQFDITYDSEKLNFVTASEKDNQGTIPSLLDINGGKTIGFMPRNINDRITIANSLIGTSCDEAPEGSGIIAFLVFEVIDSSGDKVLTIENVSFQNDCDEKNESIENLKGGTILGGGCELKSDFNSDFIVNYLDLGIFANCWLKKSDEVGWEDCDICNLDPTIDGESSLDIINYLDLGKFAEEWLLKCEVMNSK